MKIRPVTSRYSTRQFPVPVGRREIFMNKAKNGDQLKGAQAKFHISRCVLLHTDRSQTVKETQGHLYVL